MNADYLTETEIVLIDIYRDPQGFYDRLTKREKKRFDRWQKTGDWRIVASIFAKYGLNIEE